jgi:Flp pilus assembly protein TadD
MQKKFKSSRRSSLSSLRDLDIEIGFLEGLLRRDPHDTEALRILGDDYTRRGRVADGLRVDEQLTRLSPDDPAAFYNLGCSYSLAGEFELASAALHRALDLGYRDFRWLSRDPDLARFRKHPLYRRLRVRVKEIATQML